MAKHIVHHTESDSGMGFFFGVIVLVLVALALWYWGVPAYRGNMPSGGTVIEVPDKIDVNIQQDSGSGQ